MNAPRVINERDNGFARVELRYHGVDAEQKLTLHVTFFAEEQGVLETAVPEDRAMDAFNHPFTYFAAGEAEGAVTATGTRPEA